MWRASQLGLRVVGSVARAPVPGRALVLGRALVPGRAPLAAETGLEAAVEAAGIPPPPAPTGPVGMAARARAPWVRPQSARVLVAAAEHRRHHERAGLVSPAPWC
jgi:hypothetical protein